MRKNKTGRPKFEINWKHVDEMIAAGCVGTEIAAYYGMAPDTLYKQCDRTHQMTFSAYLQEKRPRGDALLRMAQFDEAIRKRDRGMLIWLGKQRLGQSDKEEVAHKGNIPIQVMNYSDQPIEPWKEDERPSSNTSI